MGQSKSCRPWRRPGLGSTLLSHFRGTSFLFYFTNASRGFGKFVGKSQPWRISRSRGKHIPINLQNRHENRSLPCSSNCMLWRMKSCRFSCWFQNLNLHSCPHACLLRDWTVHHILRQTILIHLETYMLQAASKRATMSGPPAVNENAEPTGRSEWHKTRQTRRLSNG